MQENWYCYEEINEKEVRLLRVYGDLPSLVLPEQIDGKVITQIGAYCFAKKNTLRTYQIESNGCKKTVEELEAKIQKEDIRELCGDYIQDVTLPETVVSLGNLSFYHCSKLERIEIGTSLTDIGSDVFMNCISLRKIQVNGSILKENGLKAILAQRTSETEVCFCVDGRLEAVLIYAEFSEYYDEIGPAHIFELLIDGDGFRARQCFSNGRVDIAKYDDVFDIARTRESKKTLIHTALMRLYYPIGLTESAKKQYESYLKDEVLDTGELLIKKRELSLLTFLVGMECVSSEVLQRYVDMAVAADWSEGASALLRIKSTLHKENKSDYEFDAF